MWAGKTGCSGDWHHMNSRSIPAVGALRIFVRTSKVTCSVSPRLYGNFGCPTTNRSVHIRSAGLFDALTSKFRGKRALWQPCRRIANPCHWTHVGAVVTAVWSATDLPVLTVIVTRLLRGGFLWGD